MPGFSFLSTYPPTRCGLATFTAALATALVGPGDADARIVRMMDELARPAAAPIGSRSLVVAELASDAPAPEGAVRGAARALSTADVAVIQHEFGIFGGPSGADVVRVMEHLSVPSIVVLHTVLENPTETQRAVLERVAALASSIVVMTEAARVLLGGYAVDLDRVSVIPHGAPDQTRAGTRPRRTHRSMLTWGLIGPGKGIEHGIRAVAELRRGGDEVRYRIAGQTHPKVLAHDGETYRHGLQSLIDELGVGAWVTLDDTYLDAPRLADAIADTDLVLLPYDSRTQVTSGVLVEAVAAGRPVVATAFPHAMELLEDGLGVVVAHGDPVAMAAGIRQVLDRPDEPGRAAPTALPGTSWTEVAQQYRALARPLAAHHVTLSA